MDLIDKAKKIAMTSLSILYTKNPTPLAICPLTLAIDPKQQKKEKLQEVNTFVPTRKKKIRRKVACRVVTKEVSTKVRSDNLSVARNF